MDVRRFFGFAVLGFVMAAGAAAAAAEPVPSALYSDMRWRTIGPFRGGRTVAASGVRQYPNLFYIAANNGGVWKSDDYGRVWTPIFDDQPTGSIGALAVAPSDPNVIYVGSGEGLQRPDLSTGDGLYASTDAGKTWEHLGLRNGQQIGAILVDPKDPKRLFVAVLGHPYGPNVERGVFRSTDGAKTFEKVLYKDENTGAIALAFDPANSQVVYADLWAARQGPWENGAFRGPESGLFKSADGGTTWRKLTRGLPTFADGLGRIGFCVAPSDPKRMYAIVQAISDKGGVYRSDDAGETWKRVNGEERVWGRADDFAEVKADPKNPDTLYVANTSTYKSTDGGQSFTAIKGAPGGDDYHTIWINPDDPAIILLASDQGATISVNGGRTWSSWYNQPTAQFYHVSTDNQFPYWVLGGQQECGSAAVRSRGDHGAITFRDWMPVGAEEYGYVAADPLDPNIIYGGKLSRFDRRTGQTQEISPVPIRNEKIRFLRTAPVLFSPTDPHVLYYAGNVLFKTTNGGTSWDVMSPDLSREKPEVPPSVGVYKTPEIEKMARRGVIYTIAPSSRDPNLIWAGTDDGLIHVTRDGGAHWTDVTPPALTAWSKVSLLEASHFDTGAAYAAVNRIRCDDMRPHIYRTRDGGKSWQEITKGLPDDPVNAVREDPRRKGLLFAGTERAVWVSFDDGDAWQPLRLNMPATSIRDLVIHDDDLVVGTHGRGFWILDDIAPLRQADAGVAASEAFLIAPQTATRVRRDLYTDTPLPPEEPVGQNPPDGAILDYWLKTASPSPVTLEILDASGALVRRFSSADVPESLNEKEINVPLHWARPPRILPAGAGMHRFTWDLRLPSPDALEKDFPISAITGDTPKEPLGPAVLPGFYTVRLTAFGKTGTRQLIVRMDPRVKTPAGDIEKQFALSARLVLALKQDAEALRDVKAARARVKERKAGTTDVKLGEALAALDERLGELEGAGGGRRQRRAAGDLNLSRLNGQLAGLLGVVEGADVAPTTQVSLAAAGLEASLARQLGKWKELSGELAAIDRDVTPKK